MESSVLASVGYDARTNVLELGFRAGGVYRYFGVPLRVFDELMAAPSLGRYFQAHIRDRYPTERVTGAG